MSVALELGHASARLRCVVRDAEVGRGLYHLLPRHDLDGPGATTRSTWGERDVWLKHEPFSPAAARRHRLRATLLRRPYPRLAEFENLSWLRAHGFAAPEPLAAGVGTRRGRPAWQFLITEHLPSRGNLREYLERRPEDLGELLTSLGERVAALHEAGFVHRDLFPRNVLVLPEDRVAFLDCWRGGPHRQLRGPAYDLACLFLFLERWLTVEEEERLLTAYLEGRRTAEEARERWIRAVARERGRLMRRLEREPGRLRGGELPGRTWRVAGLSRPDSLHRPGVPPTT